MTSHIIFSKSSEPNQRAPIGAFLYRSVLFEKCLYDVWNFTTKLVKGNYGKFKIWDGPKCSIGMVHYFIEG